MQATLNDAVHKMQILL